MKSIFVTIMCIIIVVSSFSQDVHLSDSVIYIDSKPVAFYHKTINETMPHYDMYVYGLKGNLLMQASVIKFNAPVAELKPFYYYEIIFKELKDTSSVYIEDEAFPVVFAKLIAEYKLIDNDKINKSALTKFKKNYPGFTLLDAKIKLMENYLVETRHLDEQVIRDRTKPVTILNDRIIMQDGVQIGTIREEENITSKDSYTMMSQAIYGAGPSSIVNPKIETKNKLVVYFVNGNKIDFERSYSEGEYSRQKEETGKSLYEISKTTKIVTYSFADQLLKKVCFLIEEYAL